MTCTFHPESLRKPSTSALNTSARSRNDRDDLLPEREWRDGVTLAPDDERGSGDPPKMRLPVDPQRIDCRRHEAPRMAAQQIMHQQRGDPERAATDGAYDMRLPRSPGADGGVDEYQPVDAVGMTRGEPRRHGSTE